jgi:predicted ABC-type transport system involved in lysophospholipase L1 biosynthesis ATPase subunit
MRSSAPTNLKSPREVAIHAQELSKSYAALVKPVRAMDGVSFEIKRGERVALLGKSGSGKSTLLNLLGGLDRPTSGSLQVADQSLDQHSSRDLADFRSTTVGMIFQGFNLIPTRTALENVELPMLIAGRPRGQRRADAIEALRGVGLAERFDHHPAQLSGGENQRVAIARALANSPRILLADEPTGNLDSGTAHEIVKLILDHVERTAATLILVTHDEELAAACTTRVLRLKDGRLIE